jgi:cytochrome bd-type quinol oxidase subunit 2
LEDAAISATSGTVISLNTAGASLTVSEQTERKREYARQVLAIIVVSSLAFIVIASFASLWLCGTKNVDDVVKVIEAVISPVVGIVGAVTGFYFGESRTSTRPAEVTNDNK